MAELHTCWSLCYNVLPAGKVKLASRALTKKSSTNILTPAVCRAPTPISAPAPTPAPPRSMYINMDLQKTPKLALKLFVQDQTYTQGLAKSRKKPLKAHFSDLH